MFRDEEDFALSSQNLAGQKRPDEQDEEEVRRPATFRRPMQLSPDVAQRAERSMVQYSSEGNHHEGSWDWPT